MPIGPNKPPQQGTIYTGPIIGIEPADAGDPPETGPGYTFGGTSTAETGPGWTFGGFRASPLPDPPPEPTDQPFPWLALALGLAGVYLWKKS